MWTLHSAVLHPSLILCFVYERLSCWQCPKIASLYNFLRNLPTSLPRKLLPFSKHHKVLKYYNIKSPLLNCFQFFLQVIYKLQVTEHSHGSYKQTNSMQEENLEMLQNTSEPVRSRQGTWDEMTKSDSSIAQFYTYDTFLIIHPVIKKLKMRLEISNISTWNMQPRKLHEHSVETTSVNIYIWWLVNWAEIHWRVLSQTYENLQREVRFRLSQEMYYASFLNENLHHESLSDLKRYIALSSRIFEETCILEYMILLYWAELHLCFRQCSSFHIQQHILTKWLTRWKKWTQYFKILGHLTSLLLPMNVFWEEFLFCWNTQCIEICTWPNFASKYIFAFLNTHLFYCQPVCTFGV